MGRSGCHPPVFSKSEQFVLNQTVAKNTVFGSAQRADLKGVAANSGFVFVGKKLTQESTGTEYQKGRWLSSTDRNFDAEFLPQRAQSGRSLEEVEGVHVDEDGGLGDFF